MKVATSTGSAPIVLRSSLNLEEKIVSRHSVNFSFLKAPLRLMSSITRSIVLFSEKMT